MKGEIVRVSNPNEGPLDGVGLEAVGVYTKFSNGSNRKIRKQSQVDVSIKGSIELGVISISDRVHGTMISVSVEDMAGVMAAAFDAARERKEEPECQEGQTKEPVGDVEKESCG